MPPPTLLKSSMEDPPNPYAARNSTRYVYNLGLCISDSLIIGYSTDYYTSNSHEPVRTMAHPCTSRPAINIIYGLALGYYSTIVPISLLASHR